MSWRNWGLLSRLRASSAFSSLDMCVQALILHSHRSVVAAAEGPVGPVVAVEAAAAAAPCPRVGMSALAVSGLGLAATVGGASSGA